MTLTSLVFFDMIAAIFILALALVVVVFHKTRKSADETLKENTHLLDEARKTAAKMIDDANSRAIDIINKANLSSEIASSTFNQQISHIASSQIKKFEKDSADFMNLYHQILLELKSKNIEMFQSLSKNIETDTIGEVKNFKDSMENLTLSSQNLVREKIKADYETAQKDIENYKNEELKKIDGQIYSLLERISNLVLGKTVSLSDHEDLILKSLEIAKKEGVFKT